MYKIYIYLTENTSRLNYRDKIIDAVNDKISSRYEKSWRGEGEIFKRFTAGGIYNNHSS